MAHKFDGAARGKLENETRRRLLAPEDTLARLGFGAGRTLADIGCGTGLFTIPAAKMAALGGNVYAVDLSEEMLADVSARAWHEDLGNIIPVRSEEYDLKLRDEAADLVLLCTVLHEVGDKPRFLSQAARVCRRGGTVAVIEFQETGGDFGPPLRFRLPGGQVEMLLGEAGLADVTRMEISEAFYSVTAKKR